MQVASVLWSEIKSQMKSERKFRLKMDQKEPKTCLRQVMTQCLDKRRPRTSKWTKLGAVGGSGPSADQPTPQPNYLL